MSATTTPSPARLNYKQKRFVQEYLRDFNGAQAAIRAGYRGRNARIAASQMLSNAGTILKDERAAR
jgi:phage terminase small subunit